MVEAAKKLVEQIPRRHEITPKKTRLTVVYKRPRQDPKYLSSVNSKTPDALVKSVKKIRPNLTSTENPIPALVDAIKKLMKNRRLFRPRAPKYVILLTKQHPRKPTKVVTTKPFATSVKTPIRKVTLVPIGRKVVPAVVRPSIVPVEVVPARKTLMPKVVGKITSGEQNVKTRTVNSTYSMGP